MFEFHHGDDAPPETNSSLNHEHDQVLPDYTESRYRLCHSSHQCEARSWCKPPVEPIIDGSQLQLPSANASPLGTPSFRIPASSETACNTDLIRNRRLKPMTCASRDDGWTDDSYTDVSFLHEGFSSIEPHGGLPIHWETNTNIPLMQFGAQFDTTGLDAAEVDSVETTSNAPITITLDALEDHCGFECKSSGSSESTTSTAAAEYSSAPKCVNQIPHATPRTLQYVAELPTYDYQRPRIIVSDQAGRRAIPVADDLYRSLPSDDLQTPAAVVEEAYQFSQALYAHWMLELNSSHELHAECAPFTPRSLFRTGLWTLRSYYDGGILPVTFEDLFGLMLVAFSFSHIIYKDGASCYWDAFSDNVYEWHHAISDDAETMLFIEAWNKLWSSKGNRGPYTVESGSAKVMVWSPPVDRHHSGGLCNDDLSEVLIEGIVVAGCSRFLDAIEYAYICQRNVNNPSAAPRDDSFDLIESVIEPLQRCYAAVMYPEHISNIIVKLRNGLLHNVRELEVSLTSCHEWSWIPRQAQNTYLDHVAIQCNKAEGRSSNAWRNRYYVADLSFAIQILDGLDHHKESYNQNLAQNQGYHGQSNAIWEPSSFDSEFTSSRPGVPCASALVPALPPVAFRASPYCNHPDSDTAETPPVTLNIGSMGSTAHSVASSDFLSGGSSPSGSNATSEPSSATTVTRTSCPHCPNKSFEGDPRNQRRNWRRHMFSEHGLNPKLKCQFPGCHVTFRAGRHDNLKRHMKQKHQGGRLSPPTSTAR